MLLRRRLVAPVERRLLAEVVDEEEERVRILRQADLRRGDVREERERDAIDAERFLEESGCRWLAKPFRLRDLVRVARETVA